MKTIAVYCASSLGADPVYRNAATTLGKLLAQRHIRLVYGGGNVGLMGQIASTMLFHGGHVTGVLPEFFQTWDIGQIDLPELRIVQSMHERKALMEKLADGFIALPGGLGTLEELAEILTWAQLGLHHKPVGLLNVAGYYDHLIAFFNHAVGTKLLKEKNLQALLVSSDPVELLEMMAAWKGARESQEIAPSQL